MPDKKKVSQFNKVKDYVSGKLRKASNKYWDKAEDIDEKLQDAINKGDLKLQKKLKNYLKKQDDEEIDTAVRQGKDAGYK